MREESSLSEDSELEVDMDLLKDCLVSQEVDR